MTIEKTVLTALDTAVLVYLFVAVLGCLARGSKRVLYIGSALTFFASLIVFSVAVYQGILILRGEAVATIASKLPFTQYPVLIDPLSIVLLLVISILSMATSIYTPRYMEYYEELGRQGFFASMLSLFILSMILIVISNNVLWFIFMWEVMTLASYLLIVGEYKEEYVVRAAWNTLSLCTS